ncbi:hypothetical protein [Tabrizicola sp. TH137]|uniref:hypothetical protein n=1 Tax=Tabrizicola sp. TH137 TaxID=2067452 RepID=UPI00117F0F2C|nr:hypothetical protein [Tabrizicola sp. TH137]
MSIQITSGVGGTVPTQTVLPTTGTTATGTTGTVLPQYNLEFAGLTRASALGLAPPSSAGDLEILFARISSALKDTLGELSELDDLAKAERFRGRLGEALAAFDQMVRWGQTIDINNENIRNQNDIEAREIVIRDEATATRTNLQSQRGSLQQQMTDNNNDIKTFTNQINSLSSERQPLQTENNNNASERQQLVNQRFALNLNPVQNAAAIALIDARIGEIDARSIVLNDLIKQIDDETTSLANQIGQKNAANQSLQTQIDTLDTRINAATETIKQAEANIAAADKSRKASQEVIRITGGLMEAFISSTIELMLVTSGKTRSDMGRDAGQITVEGDFFETLLQDMARALVGLGAALSEQQLGSDVVLHTSGAGLNQTQSTPDRFGQLSAPVARAIAFAGMIAGVLGAVADLLNNLTRGLGMQTAGSFATAGEPRLRVGL